MMNNVTMVKTNYKTMVKIDDKTMTKINDMTLVKRYMTTVKTMIRRWSRWLEQSTVTVDSTLAPLAVRDWRCQRNLQHNLLKSIFPWKLFSIYYDSCYQYFFKNCLRVFRCDTLKHKSQVFRWNAKQTQLPFVQKTFFLQNIVYKPNDRTDWYHILHLLNACHFVPPYIKPQIFLVVKNNFPTKPLHDYPHPQVHNVVLIPSLGPKMFWKM